MLAPTMAYRIRLDKSEFEDGTIPSKQCFGNRRSGHALPAGASRFDKLEFEDGTIPSAYVSVIGAVGTNCLPGRPGR